MLTSLRAWWHNPAPHIPAASSTVSPMDHARLQTICAAIRRGDYTAAAQLLAARDDGDHTDPARLNLLAVLALAASDWTQAARLWRAAVRADARYLPPRRNLRRYYELFEFGRSHVPIALGDEPEFLMDGRRGER
jgi:hypothetical protein